MRAIVIGAGIGGLAPGAARSGPGRAVPLLERAGGLAAGAALSAQGWSVTLYERAPALHGVGAGIAIAPNALRALDVLGAGDAVRRLGALQGEGGIRRDDGRWLALSSVERFAATVGVPVIVRRGDLGGILR